MDVGLLESKKDSLLKQMIDYIDEFGGEGYGKKDVNRIKIILDKYFHKMQKETNKSKNNYLTIVKETVIALNKINNKCDGLIIETDQREDICYYIINVAIYYGYIKEFIDITEEWREW
jgi:hypothetical protein